MNGNTELKRRWQEKAMWLTVTFVHLYFLGHYIIQGASPYRILLVFVYLAFFTWGAFLSFTKPDVLIKDNKIYLFGRLTAQPSVLSVADIQSIERKAFNTPIIWRVPPLRFDMRDGHIVTFSTGADESRMKRIMKFIETETSFKIKTHRDSENSSQ